MRKRQDIGEVVLNDWLAVSTDGFASMNAGREPSHLVKELVQNALDAIGRKRGTVELTLAPNSTPKTLVVTCRDNGCGMENLRDIRTVFYTSKTDSHLNRGRMGRGFKEMLCLAQKAVVASRGRRIEFAVEDGKRITRDVAEAGVGVLGMLVSMQMPWPQELIGQLEAYFRTFLRSISCGGLAYRATRYRVPPDTRVPHGFLRRDPPTVAASPWGCPSGHWHRPPRYWHPKQILLLGQDRRPYSHAPPRQISSERFRSAGIAHVDFLRMWSGWEWNLRDPIGRTNDKPN